MSWLVVYERAIRNDGSLFFPKRLTHDFLTAVRKAQGSYIFANQYQNEIIPDSERVFRPEWIVRYEQVPAVVNRFSFIDPAISQEKNADYTGIVVVAVDTQGVWYVEAARRYKMTPTEIINKVFELAAIPRMMGIGIETIAFQEALLYMVSEEMRRRKVTVPIKGIKHGNDVSKEARIMGLVPRFEWGRIFINHGLLELEDELLKFPRSAHDDICDSLSSIDRIAFTPQEVTHDRRPNPSNGDEYEQWYRRQLAKKGSRSASQESDY